MVQKNITVLLGQAAEMEARVYVCADPEAKIVKIEGHLHGPVCEFSHTLPSESQLRPVPENANGTCLSEILLMDPCYWTPELPFQYELDMTLTYDEGTMIHEKRLVGIRRWATEKASFSLERRRVVLRGCRIENLSSDRLIEARSAETALLVDLPTDRDCEAASRQGVALIADLHEISELLEIELQRLNCYPAVMIVLLSTDQIRQFDLKNSQLLKALHITAETLESEIDLAACDLLAVDFAANESPPGWLAKCGKPVIAICRGATYAELSAGRAACDRLQADLAPKFNLAGYFVSP